MRELRAVIDQYLDRVLAGETENISYYGEGHNELRLACDFPLMRTERLTPRLGAFQPVEAPGRTIFQARQSSHVC